MNLPLHSLSAAPAVPDGQRDNIGVAVLGGGNAAWALAADLSLRGRSVRMLEYPGRKSRLEHVARRGAVDIIRNGVRKTAPIGTVTQDAALALAGTGLIVVATPAFAHRAFANLVAPHLRGDETILVFTAALGGLEFAAAARRLGRTHRGPIVEVENLPYTCRIAGPSDVLIHLDVPKFVAATYPAKLTPDAERELKGLVPGITFGRDLLDPLLGNMNGVVHPPVVLLNVPVMERARGEPWWIWEVGVTKSIARVIEDLDAERLAIGRAVGISVEPVAEMMWRSGYGPRGSIYETINGCAALRNVRGPADLNHRWFTEDIPFTLALWLDLARHCGVKTPLMESLCGLASSLLGRDVTKTGRSLADVGLAGLDAATIVAALHDGMKAP
jgi:opine dehydrogenase